MEDAMALTWTERHGVYRAKAGLITLMVTYEDGGKFSAKVGDFPIRKPFTDLETAKAETIRIARDAIRQTLDELTAA